MTVIDRYSAYKLDRSNLTVLDARNIMDDFNASEELVNKTPVHRSIHIPQHPWMFNESGISGGRHPIPAQHVIDALFYSFKGEENDVVIFADDNSFFHTRLYYLFKLYGHESYLWNDTVSHMEEAFTGKNIQTFSLPELSKVTPANRRTSDIYCSMEDVQSATGDSRILLIDVRARQRYLGLTEPIDERKGHIPGSINIPTPAIYKDGAIDFSALDYMNLEFTRYDEIIVYCGSGMSATPMFIMLNERSLPVKLYGGSFSEWITDPDNTVETGDSLLNERMSRTYG